MRLLLVEDDVIQRRLLVMRLGSAGIEVEQAGDGLEAYERLRRDPPDALLCDLQMPKMDGFALLERLAREHLPLPRTIVLFSARPASPEEEAHARELGAKALLRKPIGLKELLAMIDMPVRARAIRAQR
jgi:CheY-like chemotaxis protein